MQKKKPNKLGSMVDVGKKFKDGHLVSIENPQPRY